MFKQNEKAISQIAEYIPRACRGMQLQEAKARLEKKIALYTDDGCDVAVLNAAFASALNSHTRESFFVHRQAAARGGQMITGTTNYDEVPDVRCTLCGGYYKADDPESHECEGAA